jgi:hypothetical protein
VGGSLLSGIGISAAATALDTVTVLLKQGRSIAGIVPDCTIEERHKDELEITRSPVEQGTPMADHAYLKPCQLMMRVAWSDSKSLGSLLAGAITGGLVMSVRDTYDQLQALQQDLNPFTVVTGKRSYSNMMFLSLQIVTNKESEHSLMVEALFEQVIIVSTQVQSASSLAPVANQATPANTASPVSTGNQQTGVANPVASATITGQGG